MKCLTIIWGIVLFLLACLPCTDSGTSYAQCETTTVQVTHSHADPAQDSDLCTPLCECNCCGGITIAVQVPAALQELQHFPQSTYRSSYADHGSFSHAFTFWHPPRA